MNHTGGGDGDLDTEYEEENEVGRKRNTKKGSGLAYSQSTMAAFSEGLLYPLILRVCKNRTIFIIFLFYFSFLKLLSIIINPHSFVILDA